MSNIIKTTTTALAVLTLGGMLTVAFAAVHVGENHGAPLQAQSQNAFKPNEPAYQPPAYEPPHVDPNLNPLSDPDGNLPPVTQSQGESDSDD